MWIVAPWHYKLCFCFLSNFPKINHVIFYTHIQFIHGLYYKIFMLVQRNFKKTFFSSSSTILQQKILLPFVFQPDQGEIYSHFLYLFVLGNNTCYCQINKPSQQLFVIFFSRKWQLRSLVELSLINKQKQCDHRMLCKTYSE